MRRPAFIARQAASPSGLLGRVIVGIMERETVGENEEALRALDPQASDRVLEIGFGHGRTLLRLAEQTPEGFVAGVEVSADMVERARRRLSLLIEAGRADVRHAGGVTIPYPDASFDRILSVHTLYFWRDAAGVLRELARVARPGARLVLGFRPAGAGVERAFPSTVYRFYSTDEVRRLLDVAGFAPLSGELAAARGCVLLVAIRK